MTAFTLFFAIFVIAAVFTAALAWYATFEPDPYIAHVRRRNKRREQRFKERQRHLNKMARMRR
tara:strand:- start:128 stop:316 length:189 start_codon:yes stop_codon:yes gene_type:complete